MEAAFCRTTGDEFHATLREFDADPTIGGLLVLATPDEEFTPAAVDETLRELSALSQTASTIGALTIGEAANDERSHHEYDNKTAVGGGIDGV